MNFKRVLLKLSGESLSDGFGISEKKCEQLSHILKKIVNSGIELSIVIGAGNFWRGRTGTAISRVKSDQMGMLSTSINAICLSDFLEREGINVLIQSSIEIPGIVKKFWLQDTLLSLEKHNVVIFSCGTGSPFFSTDTCASLRACEIHADVILKATTVDGIYTSDPKIDKSAKKYDSITFDEVIKNNLNVMDISAFSMCRENNVPILIFSFDDLERAILGEKVGTLVSN